MRMIKKKRLLIVGAGEASQLLLKEIEKNPLLRYIPVGYVDDFKEKGKEISGIKILGKIEEIHSLIEQHSIEEIIIAIPSLKKERLKEVVDICEQTGVETKILPGTYEVLRTWKTGLPWYKEVRSVRIEDLLRRKPALIDFKEIEKHLLNKVVLVTGGGGSIGSELCSQIAELNPSLLLILDSSEYSLYEISNTLKENHPELSFKPLLADVRDSKRIEEIFRENKVDIVFHAAAYKHVPLLESHLKEAIKNNVFGTYNVINSACKNKVGKFIFISTDKVVNPASVMGVSKNIAEKVVQLFSDEINVVIVRFGNVLGSRGSVIPLFEKQIQKGGPITITHPEVTRYFMTIPEAAQLLIQAGVIGNKGEIMVLDMGEPYKIEELAKELVRLYGLEPDKDIKFEYIGLRPGEKLHEELLTQQEGITKTKNERIFIAKAERIDKERFKENINKLFDAIEKGDESSVIDIIKDIVPSYNSQKIEEIE